MTYDYFRVTGAHDTVHDYAFFFSISLRNDDVQDFDSRWDEILLSMIKICESDQCKTVSELYDLVTRQKI